MNPKRKKQLKASDARQRKLPNRGEPPNSLSMASFDPRREADYIAECAARHDGRIVTLGVLVFFSTECGDAWMLDVEDDRAMCVARDGEPQPVNIFETANKVAIEWTGDFAIDGEAFTVITAETGHVRTILGYPIPAIRAAIEAVMARLAD